VQGAAIQRPDPDGLPARKPPEHPEIKSNEFSHQINGWLINRLKLTNPNHATSVKRKARRPISKIQKMGITVARIWIGGSKAKTNDSGEKENHGDHKRGKKSIAG